MLRGITIQYPNFLNSNSISQGKGDLSIETNNVRAVNNIIVGTGHHSLMLETATGVQVWHNVIAPGDRTGNFIWIKEGLSEVDIHNKAIIVNLIKYFIGDKTLRSDWSLHKGLLCIGDVGSGKTFLMSVMQDFCKVVRHPHHQFKMKACTNIYDAINNNNPIKSLQPYYKNNWCFDDLGDEPTTLKYYGNDIDFMTKIITRRYEIFVNGHCVTHATTNLIPKDIQEKYGARFFDPDASGCRALFNIVVFKGESRRR